MTVKRNRLNRDDILLLEQFRFQAKYYMNETRLVWTRYTVHLGISSGMITVWAYLSSLSQSPLLRTSLLAIPIFGMAVALIWIFVVLVSYDRITRIAIRLNAITKHLKVPEIREDLPKFFSSAYFRKPLLEYLTLGAPILFILVWIVLLLAAF